MTNLVQNAIDRSGKAGQVTIIANPPAVIEVLDGGGGVPPSERDRS